VKVGFGSTKNKQKVPNLSRKLIVEEINDCFAAVEEGVGFFMKETQKHNNQTLCRVEVSGCAGSNRRIRLSRSRKTG
jgi:hypothetical protein